MMRAQLPTYTPTGSYDDLSDLPLAHTNSPSKFHGAKRSSAIDYQKYRTKLCRNFQMGLPCPFEDRCVFAHGDVEVRTPTSNSASNIIFRNADSISNAASAEFPVYSPPSPASTTNAALPTYESFMAAAVSNSIIASPSIATPEDSQPSTPPSPIRYRFDPYRPEGIVYEQV